MPTTPLMTPNILDSSASYVDKAFNVALNAYHKARTVTLMDVASAPLAKRRKLKHSSTERSPSTGSSGSDKSTQELETPHLDLKQNFRKRPHKCEEKSTASNISKTQHQSSNRRTKKTKQKVPLPSSSNEVYHGDPPRIAISHSLQPPSVSTSFKRDFSFQDNLYQQPPHGLNSTLPQVTTDLRHMVPQPPTIHVEHADFNVGHRPHYTDKNIVLNPPDLNVNRTMQSNHHLRNHTGYYTNNLLPAPPNVGLPSIPRITIRSEPPPLGDTTRGVTYTATSSQWMERPSPNPHYLEDMRNNNVAKPLPHIDLSSTTAWPMGHPSTTSRQ